MSKFLAVNALKFGTLVQEVNDIGEANCTYYVIGYFDLGTRIEIEFLDLRDNRIFIQVFGKTDETTRFVKLEIPNLVKFFQADVENTLKKYQALVNSFSKEAAHG